MLVSCPDLDKIFVLIRPKNDKSSHKRVSAMLNDKPFSFLLAEDDPLKKKVVPVEGDITKQGLGFSEEDRQTLVDNVHVVFHCAASIRFDAPLKESLDFNVFATKQVIDLCRQVKQLKSFIHCSTAYSHCQRTEVDEQFYKIATNPSELLKLAEWLPNASLDQLAPHIMEGRPNTYTYTKALAEQLVFEQCQSIPTAMVRPAIVANAQSEPVEGWIDNVNGPSGISILASLGILRACPWNYYAKTDFVPVDKVANAMIAAAWATGTGQESENLKVYNITSNNVNTITWGELFENGYKGAVEAPSMRTVRPVIRPPRQTGPHPIFSPLVTFFSHWMFAYFLDLIIMLCGHKRIMVKITNKMHYALDVMQYFTQHQWTFQSNNLVALYKKLDKDDQEEFHFNMADIDWESYAKNCSLGNRRYLLKESDETIPTALKRYKRIQIAYWLFKMILVALIAFLVSYLPIYLFVDQEYKDDCALYHRYYSLYTTSLVVGGIYLFCC